MLLWFFIFIKFFNGKNRQAPESFDVILSLRLQLNKA